MKTGGVKGRRGERKGGGNRIREKKVKRDANKLHEDFKQENNIQ